MPGREASSHSRCKTRNLSFLLYSPSLCLCLIHVVCGSLVLSSLAQLQLFQFYGCQVINGSMVLQLTTVSTVPRALLRMPSVQHITGTLALYDIAGRTLRDFFPNLVSIHGRAHSVFDFLLFYRFSISNGLFVAGSDFINISLIAQPQNFVEKADGVAVLNGQFASFTVRRSIYLKPTPLQQTTLCDAKQPTPSCCTRIYDGSLRCSEGKEEDCLPSVIAPYLIRQGSIRSLAVKNKISCTPPPPPSFPVLPHTRSLVATAGWMLIVQLDYTNTDQT